MWIVTETPAVRWKLSRFAMSGQFALLKSILDVDGTDARARVRSGDNFARAACSGCHERH